MNDVQSQNNHRLLGVGNKNMYTLKGSLGHTGVVCVDGLFQLLLAQVGLEVILQAGFPVDLQPVENVD